MCGFFKSNAGSRATRNNFFDGESATDERPEVPQEIPVETPVAVTAQRPALVDVNPSRVEHRITSVFSAGLSMRGNLVLDESILISGEVQGSVFCSKQGMMVIIRAGGFVEGDVEAESVLVAGKVSGRIRAKLLKLYATAEIEGEAEYERLVVMHGAKIGGAMTSLNEVVIGQVTFEGEKPSDRVAIDRVFTRRPAEFAAHSSLD